MKGNIRRNKTKLICLLQKVNTKLFILGVPFIQVITYKVRYIFSNNLFVVYLYIMDTATMSDMLNRLCYWIIKKNYRSFGNYSYIQLFTQCLVIEWLHYGNFTERALLKQIDTIYSNITPKQILIQSSNIGFNTKF